MPDTIRWGVLGAAKFAREHMAPAINAARNATLSALATSDPAKAAPFAAIAPGLRVHDDYDALLADPEIDAVYIPLPNHLHVDWTLKALDAGKHVLCEKPLTLNAAQFDTVIARCDATGLVAAEAYMIVHHPQWHKARELVAEGAIGYLVAIDAVFTYDNSTDPGNIRNRPETGGGSLPDIGVYTIGAARFASGEEPDAVEARITRENGVDVFAHVTADFPSFRFSSITSMRAFPRQYVTIHGRKGTITLTAPFNANVYGQAELHLRSEVNRTETLRWPGVNHYILQVENFGAAIRGEAPYPCPLEFSRGTQAMIDRAFAAADRERDA